MTTNTKATFLVGQTIFLFCFLLLLLPTLYAQEYPEKYGTIKFAGHSYQRITETLYACDVEVTNEDYKNFLSYLLSDDYEKCKIDSSLWSSKPNLPDTFTAHMVKYYHTHSAFDKYPVVNIPYYGAVKYCEWLTKRYNRLPRKKNVSFKLPTEQEWQLLANIAPSTKLPYNVLNGKNSEQCYLVNIKSMIGDSVSLGEDGGFYTVRTDAYWPSRFGLYNVVGNVAEMTDVDGVQKGGSWLDDINDCTADKVQTYSTPDPRVGFRVIMIISSK